MFFRVYWQMRGMGSLVYYGATAMRVIYPLCGVAMCLPVIAILFFSLHTSVAEDVASSTDTPVVRMPMNAETYDAKVRALANTSDTSRIDPYWPVTDAAYPLEGALLPKKRIVAYYGNFYSKGMGILGQYAEDVVLDRLRGEVRVWEAADPATPVVPAIDYIAVTAQRDPGADGMYRLRMPDSHIARAVAMAEKVDGIVILEVQPGLSDMMTELRALESYLALPQVHVAIDPEFAMRGRGLPGRVVGTVSGAQMNEVAEYLASIVSQYDLPPKTLIVHRYTQAMVTDADEITPLPEVQIVMDMDGWGPPAQKVATYNAYIYPEPVQFTGFKLFYRNDTWQSGSRLVSPEEVLDLVPIPSFIQYQ